MKKIIIFAATIFAAGAMMAQTFVSTEPTNKNVVLEEYTGINCGYCPDGHRLANELAAANPGRVFPINIHTGSYAANTYTTQYGTALANQTGLTGYPSGTVNRHVFTGSATALNRGQWATYAPQILNATSPVNVAAHATLDFATRQMTIVVEAYYTDNSAVATNMLNVAILQDNIIGQQGGASANPAQVVEGGKYRHMHMLRDLVTGQWGETIPATTQGTFFTQTYNYTVPTTITGDNSGSEVMLDDLDVIVFVAEGHQEILTGCRAEMTYVNAAPMIKDLKAVVVENCEIEFSANATIKNMGSTPITSAELTYTIDGASNTYNWTGSIASGATGDIQLPVISGNFQSEQTYGLVVEFTGLNGQPFSGGSKTVNVSKAVYSTTAPLAFSIKTDQYGDETTWKFMKADGTVLYQDGPYSQGTAQVHDYTFAPTETGCYILEVYDAYGDGINAGYGAGYFTLSNGEGRLFRDNGKFGQKAQYFINVTQILGIDEEAQQILTFYPNPTHDMLNINCNQTIREVSVFDMAGRRVMSIKGSCSSISTANLANGVYTLSVTTDNGVSVQKFVKE